MVWPRYAPLSLMNGKITARCFCFILNRQVGATATLTLPSLFLALLYWGRDHLILQRKCTKQ